MKAAPKLSFLENIFFSPVHFLISVTLQSVFHLKGHYDYAFKQVYLQVGQKCQADIHSFAIEDIPFVPV